MKKLLIALLLCGLLMSAQTSYAREISIDVGGLFNNSYMGSIEFFNVAPNKTGVTMVLHLGIFPIKNYDADISAGVDAKFYLSEEAVISSITDFTTTHYTIYKPKISTRITGSLGIIASCDYDTEDEFKYGVWLKLGMGYKVIFKQFTWFGNYAFIEPGMNIYIGTDKIIPALSNVPTQGFPRLYLNVGVGI